MGDADCRMAPHMTPTTQLTELYRSDLPHLGRLTRPPDESSHNLPSPNMYVCYRILVRLPLLSQVAQPESRL